MSTHQKQTQKQDQAQNRESAQTGQKRAIAERSQRTGRGQEVSPPSAIDGLLQSPLPDDLGKEAQQTFGRSLNPRVLQGDGLADAHQAHAVTQGDQIHLSADLDPFSAQGRDVLRHEIAHVAQKSTGGGAPQSVTAHSVEADADLGAQAMSTGQAHAPLADSATAPRAKKKQPTGGVTGTKAISRKNAHGKTVDVATHKSTAVWGGTVLETLTLDRFKGFGVRVQKKASDLIVWLEKAKAPGTDFLHRDDLKVAVTGLLDAVAAEVAANPKLADLHETLRGYAKPIFSASIFRPGRPMGGLAMISYVTKILDKLAATGGWGDNATKQLLASRTTARAAIGDSQHRERGGTKMNYATVDVHLDGKIGTAVRKGTQTFSIRFNKDTVTLYTTLPFFKAVATLPNTARTGDLKGDALRAQLKKLFQTWLNTRPPIPTGTVSIPQLGVEFSYTNDKLMWKIIEFFNKGNAYADLKKIADWAVVAGGALCLAGFIFPGASVVGSALNRVGGAMVGIATAIQLPALTLLPGAEIISGYRSMSGTDLLNLMGVLSSVGGLAKSVGQMGSKAASKIRSMRGIPDAAKPSAKEVSTIRRLTGKTATMVLRVADPVSDVYAIYLSSSAIYEKFKQVVDGKVTDVRGLIWSFIGDICCLGAGIKGARGHTRAVRNAMDAPLRARLQQRFQKQLAQKAAEIRALSMGKGGISKAEAQRRIAAVIDGMLATARPQTFTSSSEAQTMIQSWLAGVKPARWAPIIVGKVKSAGTTRFDPDHGKQMDGGNAKVRAARGKAGKRRAGSAKTNTSASDVSRAKVGKEAVDGPDVKSATGRREVVKTRILAAVDGLCVRATELEKFKSRGGGQNTIWHLPTSTASGNFPSEVYTTATIKKAFATFRSTFNSGIVAGSKVLKSKPGLSAGVFSNSFTAVAATWKRSMVARLNGLSETEMDSLFQEPFLPIATPLSAFTKALKSTDYVQAVSALSGELQAKKEILFHKIIAPVPDWTVFYSGGHASSGHTQVTPPARPTSPTASFPNPPQTLRLMFGSNYLRLWNDILSLQSGQAAMNRAKEFVTGQQRQQPNTFNPNLSKEEQDNLKKWITQKTP